jgi:predicted Rossmann-fold nucleotide-binding protein
MERLTRLVSGSDVYIALPGSVGTLGEIVLVWNHINIDFRVRKSSLKHLILWREPFERFVSDTFNSLGLKSIDVENIHFVDSPEDAIKILKIISLGDNEVT